VFKSAKAARPRLVTGHIVAKGVANEELERDAERKRRKVKQTRNDFGLSFLNSFVLSNNVFNNLFIVVSIDSIHWRVNGKASECRVLYAQRRPDQVLTVDFA
jgi:hypothetical protein